MQTKDRAPSMDSRVERKALEESGEPLVYASQEKTGVIVVDSFPALGTLAALRFIEWVQHNPDGVVALPTGKTPEHFIKQTARFLHGWKSKDIQRELGESGVEPKTACDLGGIRFVQIDEFYPINPLHHNSFFHYVNRYYIDGFGLDVAKALLIDGSQIGLAPGQRLEDVWPDDEVDLSLRYRLARSRREQLQKDVIQQIDEWCTEREQRIRDLGGIGFFLGGIGPDGHIGFNVRGSDLYSTTRLSAVNYETQAAAATDLGGIEVARRRLVITIGLATITHNPACTAIVIAAGEAKAAIVRDAVENERHIRYPATALQVLRNARFYLTRGAASRLEARQLAALKRAPTITESQVERAVVDLSLAKGVRIDLLTEDDFRDYPLTAELLARGAGSAEAMCSRTVARLKEKLEVGTRTFTDAVFLHTEPHHDDLILGCLPLIVRHVRQPGTHHYFAALTSGFTAVTNAFMRSQVKKLQRFMESEAFAMLDGQGYFDPADAESRNEDVWCYLDGVAADSRTLRNDGEMRRMYRNLVEIFDETDADTLKERVEELIYYFETEYPGQKDLDHIQRLKGMCREWEAECLWGYFGWRSESVRHLRLGFYTGDMFTDEPTMDRDVPPIANLLREVKPDVVTLALDPEASGPDTHYKALQAVSGSLRLYQSETGASDITILGYRNVWYRFHPSEADLFVPVSLNMFALQHSAFMNTFVSQRDASFPSPEHDGPFSELAQKIQVAQYRMLATCLGREYFYEHPSPLIRATRGMCFLKRMRPEELYRHSREIKKSTENV